MIKLKINGQDVEVEKGTTVLEAARTIGIELPHFCYHPALERVGSCRLCQAEFKAPGRPRLDVTCRTLVAEGMEVETHSEAALKARAGVLEFLLANHPLDCPICDKAGECPLQNYTYECGFTTSRYDEAKRLEGKREPFGGHIIFDAERCVLCTRCVRFMDDFLGEPQLMVRGRGDHTRIDIFPGKKLDSNYTGNLADICPVGALTLEEFRFKVRTWFLTEVPSVCPYCSRGCNIHLDIRKTQNRLFRVRPRENLDVNGYFICNEGRFRPLEAVDTEQRLREPLIHGGACTLEEGLDRAAQGLKDHEGKVLVVASARRTLEELYLISRVFGSLEGARLVAAAPDREEPDRILRTGEMAPNVQGLKVLGFEILPLDALGSALEDPDTNALVMLDAAMAMAPEMREAFRFILFMDYVTSSVAEIADVTLPGLPWFEKEGTFINSDGRVQRIRAALKPPFKKVKDDLVTLAGLGRRILGEDLPSRAGEVFQALAGSQAPFQGMTHDSIGEGGTPLKQEGGEAHE